jgi:hypothetical protein
MRARKPAPRAEFGINRIHSLVRGKLKNSFCPQMAAVKINFFFTVKMPVHTSQGRKYVAEMSVKRKSAFIAYKIRRKMVGNN